VTRICSIFIPALSVCVAHSETPRNISSLFSSYSYVLTNSLEVSPIMASVQRQYKKLAGSVRDRCYIYLAISDRNMIGNKRFTADSAIFS